MKGAPIADHLREHQDGDSGNILWLELWDVWMMVEIHRNTGPHFKWDQPTIELATDNDLKRGPGMGKPSFSA